MFIRLREMPVVKIGTSGMSKMKNRCDCGTRSAGYDRRSRLDGRCRRQDIDYQRRTVYSSSM